MLGWPARQVLALLLVCAAEPASPWAGGEAAADHFPPGSRVELHGLRTTGAALNGQNGTVRAFDADARRYSVLLDGAFWAKRIKPANLKPARPAPAGASGSLPRPWWVVYDAVAASLATLAVWLGMQLCWQFSVSPPQSGEPSAKPAAAEVVEPKETVCSVCKPSGKRSPPASAPSSVSALSDRTTSTSTSNTSRSGTRSWDRFPSKPSNRDDRDREKKLQAAAAALVSRRPTVFPPGVTPQDYINERDWVTWMSKDEEQAAIAQLRELLAEFRGEEGSPEDRFLSEMTLTRYLRARKGDVEAAANMLEETLAWRRASGVAAGTVDCPICCERPGTHTWRQIGFSRQAMPVIYSCAKQEPPGTKVQPQDANCHSEPATPLCFAQRFCATWSNHQLKRGADRQCSTR